MCVFIGNGNSYVREDPKWFLDLRDLLIDHLKIRLAGRFITRLDVLPCETHRTPLKQFLHSSRVENIYGVSFTNYARTFSAFDFVFFAFGSTTKVLVIKKIDLSFHR